MNARIRKRYLVGEIPIAYIGQEIDLTYPAEFLGSQASLLKEIAEDNTFCKNLKEAENPMIIVGNGLLSRDDTKSLLNYISEIIKKFDVVHKRWNGFNVLHSAASRVAGLDIGFLPGKSGKSAKKMLSDASTSKMGMIWLLGADEIDTSA